jgi:hypothetical protein
MPERLLCQVCGRRLVPLKNGLHRNHKLPGSRDPYTRCPGSGYRAARWPVGQHLRHHAGTLWEVIEDRGGRWGDYLVRRLPGGPDWMNERPVGTAMVVHGEYMHRHGWLPAEASSHDILAEARRRIDARVAE